MSYATMTKVLIQYKVQWDAAVKDSSWDQLRLPASFQEEEKEEEVCVHAVDACAWIRSEHIFEPRASEPLKRTHFS